MASMHPLLQPARQAANWLLDLVLPPRCPACGEIVGRDRSFCAACWQALRFITAPQCAACGMPFEFDPGAGALCGACSLKRPRYSSARAALVYDGPARQVLLAFKNRDREHLAKVMAPAMARVGAPVWSEAPLLVPVPLHRWRLWRRGYNQAALLAQALGRLRGAEVDVDALVRVRATRSSRGLGRRARAANVRGVFRVAAPARIKGRCVVLIDDVITTGATVEACTRLLLRAGAAQVHILTWARVVRNEL